MDFLISEVWEEPSYAYYDFKKAERSSDELNSEPKFSLGQKALTFQAKEILLEVSDIKGKYNET